MPWSWTPNRRDERELMDAPGLPDAEVTEAYRVLTRVNRQFGNLRSVRRETERWLAEDGPWGVGQVATLLDVGSGSGDIPRSLAGVAGRTAPTAVWALDRDPTAVSLAHRSGLNVVQGDALRLPFADRSFDLVTAVKFAHHFAGSELTRLLAEMTRVARLRVLVLDLRRHWIAYYGFMAWSRVFTDSRLVRYDGPLSVLRGFTAQELGRLGTDLPAFEWTVRAYPGFQLALVGRRLGNPDHRTSGA